MGDEVSAFLKTGRAYQQAMAPFFVTQHQMPASFARFILKHVVRSEIGLYGILAVVTSFFFKDDHTRRVACTPDGRVCPSAYIGWNCEIPTPKISPVFGYLVNPNLAFAVCSFAEIVLGNLHCASRTPERNRQSRNLQNLRRHLTASVVPPVDQWILMGPRSTFSPQIKGLPSP